MKKFSKTLDKDSTNVYNVCMKDKEKKMRKDITIYPSDWKLAQELASNKGMSVSTLITTLIRECK